MRTTRTVSIFPVGFIAKLPVSTPIVSDSGTFVRFFDGWFAGRKFPVDMAGFAVNLDFYLKASCVNARLTSHFGILVGSVDDRYFGATAFVITT